MCRQVKSIEIIEFGYEKSTEGTNGAKSEYCVDKHRLSITRPYQSALREATPNRTAVDGLRALQDLWLKALAELKWIPGESDERIQGAGREALRGLQRARQRDPRGARRRQGQGRDRRRQGQGASRRQPRRSAGPTQERELSRAALTADPDRRRRRAPIRELAAILGDGGVLAGALPGFRFRPQQLAMADAVAARHRAARPR